ncbi:MAG: hypothetical protein IT364_00465 [Candidatus Hydrogenedentes bacterium]|nr:hypothetical protein [Candidatus Hydrogenedentota bacterium]
MNGQIKGLVVGLLLGVALTISAAVFAGPTVNVTSTVGPSTAGRFCFQSHMENGKGSYAVLDTESGVVRVFSGEGSVVTIDPEHEGPSTAE